MALVVRVDAVGQVLGTDEVAAGDEDGVPSRRRLFHRRPQVGEGGSQAVGRGLGVGAEYGADDHDRRVGMALADHVDERPDRRSHHVDRMRRARPAVRAVGDRDHVGVQRCDLLGRCQLATRRARVPHVHDVEAVLASGDRRPRQRRTGRHPALGHRVAVGDPTGLVRRRGLDPSADAAERLDGGPHPLRQIDGRPLVARPPAEGEAHAAIAELGLLLVDELAAPIQREGAPGAVSSVAEVLGLGHVGDVDGVGLTHDLQPDADGQLGRLPRVPGNPGVGRVGSRVRHRRRAREGTPPDERRRFHCPTAPSDTGTSRRRRHRRRGSGR